MQFEIFTVKQLQTSLAILNQFERKGINDLKVVNKAIRDTVKNQTDKFIKESKPNYAPKCPSCEKGVLMPVKNAEGLKIYGCGICRYSEIREENNGK